MGERVAIVGVGQTHFKSKNSEVCGQELINIAVRKALENAELTMKDIDAIILGNMDLFEMINSTDMWSVDGSGAFMKPILKICTGGETGSSTGHAGFFYAASGLFPTVLAIGWEQNSESDTTGAIATHCDPIVERDYYAGAIGGLAAMYTAYMGEYGATEEDAAIVSVRDHNNAARYNPYAHLRKEITVEDVMKSAYISWPVKLLDMCPRSDGACAVIFAEEKRAKKICRQPAWVIGLGNSHPQTYIADGVGQSDLTSLRIAADQAYRMAGITNPLEQFDVAELYLPASTAGVQWMDPLQFCPKGGAPKLIRSGATEMGGKLPINPSGGVLATNAIGATGLVRIGEAALQVMGRAEAKQVDGVKVALATGFGGHFWSEVTILSSKPYLA